MQQLELGYYEKDFDATAFELYGIGAEYEPLLLDSVADKRTAVLEVRTQSRYIDQSFCVFPCNLAKP